MPRVVYEPYGEEGKAALGQRIGRSGNLIVENLVDDEDEDDDDEDEHRAGEISEKS